MYVVKDSMIINTGTGKKLRNMDDIAKHLNWLDGSDNYIRNVNKDSIQYGYADYSNLEEICELCNCLWKAKITKTFCDKKFEKHMKIKAEKERKPPVPYTWDGRFNLEHTVKKGFWLEDWMNGRVYYFHINEHIDEIVSLLNDLTNKGKFYWHHCEVGNVIEDNNNKRYVLGDSKDVGLIRDILNYYDRKKYGKRHYPYKHLLM